VSEEVGNYTYAFLGTNISSRLDQNVFRLCKNLSSVTLNSNISSFGSEMFYGSGIRHITIPDGVTTIPSLAFAGCYALKSVSIPDSVISIGTSAFMNCYNLTDVELPPNITRIQTSLFKNCRSLTSINFPGNI
jgi:hypothetical protein